MANEVTVVQTAVHSQTSSKRPPRDGIVQFMTFDPGY
jgi:hypothetical protein